MRRNQQLVGLVLIAGLSGAALPAAAAMMTGRDLANQCNLGDEFCTGYVVGVIDQWGWLESHVEEMRKCRPEGIRLRDLTGIVTTYLAAHPEKHEASAAELVSSSLTEAFTC